MKTSLPFYLALIFLLNLSFSYHAQSQSCNGAQPIQCGQTISSNNILSANNYNRDDFTRCYEGNASFNGSDVLYELFIPKAGITNVTLSGLSANLDLFFFTCNANRLSCFGNSINPGTSSESVNINSNFDNITIYILVDGANTSQKSVYNLSISSDDCRPQLSCNDATVLSCNRTYNFDNFNADNNVVYNDYGSTCMQDVHPSNNPFSGNDRLFKIDVNQSTNLRISMTGLSKDLDLFLYRGCDGDQLVQCLDRSTNGNNENEEINFPQAQGTYYLVVDGFNEEQSSNFKLNISCESNTIACNDAVLLDCNKDYNFNNINTGNNFNNDNDLYDNCLNGSVLPNHDYAAEDLLFSFEVVERGKVSIEMTALTAQFDFFVYEACNNGLPNNCVGGSFRGGRFDETFVIENALGTYFIIVDAINSNQSGKFNIKINSATCDGAVDDLCSDAISLNCGLTYNFSTTTAKNNFVYADYEGSCTERIGATDNPFDAPDRLFRFTSNQSQNLSVQLSGLSADLDLFLFKDCINGSLQQCLSRSISFGVADEEILIENALGTYYLVVDGYTANEQSDFSLTLDCEREQIQRPTICDIGGDFISTNRNLIVNLSTESSEDASLSYLADETGCIRSAFDGKIPDDYYFDSYVLFLEEENAEEGFGIAINPGDTNDGFFAFLFTCDVNESGEIVSKCIDQSEEEDASLFFLPEEGEGAGFYYIVVAGPDGEDYDLGVVPDGPCGTNGFTLNSFNEEIIEDIDGLDNDFDRTGNNADIFSCYTGDQNYTGDDIVYQIVIEETTNISFTVSPFESNEIFGLFLYDYLCGGECLDFDEVSFEGGEILQPANITTTLDPGFYYLVVDKATAEGNGEYILNLTSDTVLQDFIVDLQCTDTLGHLMFFSEDFVDTRLGNHTISSTDVFGYYYPKRDALTLAEALTYSNASNLQENAATPEEPEKCGFDEGDQIYIKVDDGVSRIYDVRPVYGPKLDGSPSDEVFTIGGESIMDSLIQINVDPFTVRPSTIDFGGRPAGTTRQILVLAFGAWEITGPDWLTFTPSSGNRPTPVRVTLNNNFPSNGRSDFIKITKVEESSQFINTRTVGVSVNSIAINNRLQSRQLPITNDELVIFPNPARKYFSIQLQSKEVVKEVALFDGFGKKMNINPTAVNNSTMKFDTDGLSAGIYLVKVVLTDRILTKKVLVSK